MPRHRPYVFDDSDRPPDAYFHSLLELRPSRWVWTCWDCDAHGWRTLGGRNVAFADYLIHREQAHPEETPDE